jgi:hypothetical protein
MFKHTIFLLISYNLQYNSFKFMMYSIGGALRAISIAIGAAIYLAVSNYQHSHTW